MLLHLRQSGMTPAEILGALLEIDLVRETVLSPPTHDLGPLNTPFKSVVINTTVNNVNAVNAVAAAATAAAASTDGSTQTSDRSKTVTPIRDTPSRCKVANMKRSLGDYSDPKTSVDKSSRATKKRPVSTAPSDGPNPSKARRTTRKKSVEADGVGGDSGRSDEADTKVHKRKQIETPMSGAPNGRKASLMKQTKSLVSNEEKLGKTAAVDGVVKSYHMAKKQPINALLSHGQKPKKPRETTREAPPLLGRAGKVGENHRVVSTGEDDSENTSDEKHSQALDDAAKRYKEARKRRKKSSLAADDGDVVDDTVAAAGGDGGASMSKKRMRFTPLNDVACKAGRTKRTKASNASDDFVYDTSFSSDDESTCTITQPQMEPLLSGAAKTNKAKRTKRPKSLVVDDDDVDNLMLVDVGEVRDEIRSFIAEREITKTSISQVINCTGKWLNKWLLSPTLNGKHVRQLYFWYLDARRASAA